MPDKFSKEVRSKIMSKIKSNKTKPELLLKSAIVGMKFRYHPKVYGKPDFALKNKKIAIFVDGCFWHKCPKCFREPKSNLNYWFPKIERNVKRAKEVKKKLKADGWKVIRIWEHEILKNINNCVMKVSASFNK